MDSVDVAQSLATIATHLDERIFSTAPPPLSHTDDPLKSPTALLSLELYKQNTLLGHTRGST